MKIDGVEVETRKISVTKVKEVKFHDEWKGAGPKWSAGVQTSEGDWINVNKFKEEDVKQIMEGVEPGGQYTVYLEGQYKNVKSFVLIDDGSDPRSHTSDEDLAQEAKQVDKMGGGGGSQSTFNGARSGMLLNNAVALAIAENKATKEQIEANYKWLKSLLDVLEK